MRQILIYFGLIIQVTHCFASPWFIGPLLAPAAHTLARGHTNLELYGFDVITDGVYNNAGKMIQHPKFRSHIISPFLSHGVTDWLDVQLTPPYLFNATRGVRDNKISDISAGLGFQLMEQKESTDRADIRVQIQETFPTGKYEYLNPELLGTDSSGAGSYQTQLSVSMQYLKKIFETHYLRTRLTFLHMYSSPVSVHGFNSYGGDATTSGRIGSGTEEAANLAFEFTLTQHWVAILEGTISKGRAPLFNGIFDMDNIGGSYLVNDPSYEKHWFPL